MNKKIEKIHRDFSFDLLELVRQSNDVGHLERIKPALVPVETFTNRVECYRRKYPTYNFVTEKQIAEICHRYGLVFGTLMNFSASIPIKNRLQIERFNLLDDDAELVDHDLPNRLFRLLTTNGGRLNVPASFVEGAGFVELRSGFKPADMNKPFDIVPIGEHFTLLRCIDDNTYRIFLEIDIHGSPWFIEFGRGRIDFGTVTFAWRQSDGGSRFVNGRFVRTINHHAEVGLRLTLPMIQKMNRVSLLTNVSPMVVADRSMFQRYGDATEIVGHRVRFKQTQDAANTTFSFVDDPIILQPVPFGYFVVTKWGNESRIADFNDSRSN